MFFFSIFNVLQHEILAKNLAVNNFFIILHLENEVLSNLYTIKF